MKVKIISTEIEKVADYGNGFSCEYKINGEGELISHCFIKNELPYRYVSDINTLQRTLLHSIMMQTDEARELFPRSTTEDELLSVKDFSSYYHFYQSANNTIRDYEGNILNTCLQVSNRFLNVWGFEGRTIEEFIELMEVHTLYVKVIRDGEGKPYCINYLLHDEDFKTLYDMAPKRIHEEDTSFYLRNLIQSKVKTLTKDIIT